jgi:hypothetical protein
VAAAKPEPAEAQARQALPSQQAAKAAEPVPQASAPTVGQAKPSATILPTQEMPAAQGLD